MARHYEGWGYPGIRAHQSAADGSHEDGIARRDELIVHADDWPKVEQVLLEHGIGFSPNPPVAYGLRRVRLSDDYDAITESEILRAIDRAFEHGRARFGRNRIMARARVEFDDDATIEGTPKVLPSSADSPQPMPPPGVRPPYREPSDGRAVRVGVVDSALTRHSALDGLCVYRPVPSTDLVHGEVISEVTGHATFIAGIITRIAPNSVVHVENVVESDGLADMVAVHDAICRLAENGVDVVNLSLGCVTKDGEQPFVLSHAFDWVSSNVRRPIVFVGSSGNGGTDKKFWPAAYPAVWAVGGASRGDAGWALADYSGRGSWVDVVAPSDDVYSTWPELGPGVAHYDAWATWSGTSFATAIVSGLVAAALASGRPPMSPDSGPLDVDGVVLSVDDGGRTIPLYGTDAPIAP